MVLNPFPCDSMFLLGQDFAADIINHMIFGGTEVTGYWVEKL